MGAAAVTGGAFEAPIDFRLYRLAKEMGVPPWEFTRPLPPDQDAERTMWLERILQFRHLEAQARNVRHG